MVYPLETTTYSVVVTDEDGCTSTDEITIVVEKDRPVYIPNSFSPNGDGINDYFTIFGGRSVQRINTLRIYNRWGAELFRKDGLVPNDELDGWNGEYKNKPMNTGVYIYYAEIVFVDGKVEIYPGSITLLR